MIRRGREFLEYLSFRASLFLDRGADDTLYGLFKEMEAMEEQLVQQERVKDWYRTVGTLLTELAALNQKSQAPHVREGAYTPAIQTKFVQFIEHLRLNKAYSKIEAVELDGGMVFNRKGELVPMVGFKIDRVLTHDQLQAIIARIPQTPTSKV